ncbi:MAG: M20/M25/M40 family metallo-hydrolase [Candidatus Sericytochromatia bacterium]
MPENTASLAEQLKAYLQQHQETIIAQLMELVRIPSISARKEHASDCRRVLDKMAELVGGYGFTPEIFETPGNPVLVATLETDAARPWLLIYNHMDVQPAAEPQWLTAPFEPVLKDGRIYGRGSTDDKGPALTALHAVHCLHAAGLSLPNIQLIYETEEEIGSTHFGWFLDQHRERIQSPASILVSDTIFEGDHPALSYRLRGLLRAEAELVTGTQDLHSGMVGGAAVNPLNLLIRALAQCVDGEGRITIPGVSEELPPVSAAESQELEKTVAIFDRAKLIEDTGGAKLYSDEARDLLERIWLQPTFEVHGFEGVQTEVGVIKTALPYAVKAKLTMRLVAGQDPIRVAQQLEAHLKSVHPDIHLTVKSGVKGCFSEVDNAFILEAVAACEAGFGQAPVFVGSGGTIGALPEFQRIYPDAPLVLIAQSLMSDGYHAPNENFRLSQIQAGFTTMGHYLSRIASLR